MVHIDMPSVVVSSTQRSSKMKYLEIEIRNPEWRKGSPDTITTYAQEDEVHIWDNRLWYGVRPFTIQWGDEVEVHDTPWACGWEQVYSIVDEV